MDETSNSSPLHIDSDHLNTHDEEMSQKDTNDVINKDDDYGNESEHDADDDDGSDSDKDEPISSPLKDNDDMSQNDANDSDRNDSGDVSARESENDKSDNEDNDDDSVKDKDVMFPQNEESPKDKFDKTYESYDANENADEEPQSESQYDANQSERGPKVGELIADIFGESDSEGEFEGFEGQRSSQLADDNDDDRGESQAKDGESQNVDNIVPDVTSDEDSDPEDNRKRKSDDIVYDFDIMMQRKKEESYRRRKRKNVDIINDNDDVIADIIRDMKVAADEDFEHNKNRMAATSKLKMLTMVVAQMRKLDLREAFLDAGVLGVITDWLTPLPDRSLPHLQIRENMLKILGEFNVDDVERIKASGIGKAVMYLFKHPKETKENKRRAGQLISAWSRPIFNCESDFHSMSKEEREQRDFEHMKKTKRMRAESTNESDSTPVKAKSSDEKNLRPGDKGWVPRARVPMPSMKDYVIRPKSNVDEISRIGSKRMVSRIDKHLRNFREKKKMSKSQRAVPISIEGRKMAL